MPKPKILKTTKMTHKAVRKQVTATIEKVKKQVQTKLMAATLANQKTTKSLIQTP